VGSEFITASLDLIHSLVYKVMNTSAAGRSFTVVGFPKFMV
jgi:hypothetical protein